MSNDDQTQTLAVGRPIGRMELRKFSWGGGIEILGNEVHFWHEGSKIELLLPNVGKSGPDVVGQWASCAGCPNFGVDSKGSRYCASPEWIEIYECPQWLGSFQRFQHVTQRCPMLGLKDRRMMRLYRVLKKAEAIFWDYYHAAGKNPRAEGFFIPRFGKK